MLFQKNDRIIFLGDSLTCRTGVVENTDPAKRFKLDYCGSYVDILVKRLLVHYPELRLSYYNKGVGGNTVPDLLARIDRDVLALKPNWVVLLIGQNDSARYTEAEFKFNLEKLLNIFKQRSIQSLLLTTTPNPHPDRNIILKRFDLIIQEIARNSEQLSVDVKTAFEKIMNYNESSEPAVALFNDGCHLTELGNMLLADVVFDTIAGNVAHRTVWQ